MCANLREQGNSDMLKRNEVTNVLLVNTHNTDGLVNQAYHGVVCDAFTPADVYFENIGYLSQPLGSQYQFGKIPVKY